MLRFVLVEGGFLLQQYFGRSKERVRAGISKIKEKKNGEKEEQKKNLIHKGEMEGSESRRRRKCSHRQPVPIGLLYTPFDLLELSGEGHVFSVTPAGQNAANSLQYPKVLASVHRPKDLQFAFCLHAAWHLAMVS